MLPVALFWARRLAALDLGPTPDLVLAVPLGRQRSRERGYNQSAEMARQLARLRGWKYSRSGLARRRETLAQSGLTVAERHRNVDGAFQADRAVVGGKCILLVDDVLTTGATVNAAATALRRAGATEVRVATAARADLWALTGVAA